MAAWEIVGSTYLGQQLALTLNEYGAFLSGDGTKLYTTRRNNITQYLLTPAKDISSAVLDVSISGESYRDCFALYFSQDGLYMYEIEFDYEYSMFNTHRHSLSTAWDIGSATFLDSTGSLGQVSSGVISADGTKMFVSEDAYIKEYPLSTAFDITSFGTAVSINKQNWESSGIAMSIDGTKLYESAGPGALLYQSNLSTPWDITSVVNTVSIPAENSAARQLSFPADGSIMAVYGENPRGVEVFELVSIVVPEAHVTGTATITAQMVLKMLDRDLFDMVQAINTDTYTEEFNMVQEMQIQPQSTIIIRTNS